MYIQKPLAKSNPHPQTSQPQSNLGEAAYQKLLLAFEALAEVADPIRAEFELIQQARSHKIPLSSFRNAQGLAHPARGGTK